MTITKVQYQEAADRLNCEVAMIKAVGEIESANKGFSSNGEPKVRFEAHYFSKLTKRIYDDKHPTLSTRSWNPKLYAKTVAGEHKRLDKAVKLDRDAALMSASWGMFQILGANWEYCNYRSIQEFINAIYEGEPSQLDGFIRFVRAGRLDRFLRDKRFDLFAEKYNGPGYKANRYDEKMEAAYNRYAKTGECHGSENS